VSGVLYTRDPENPQSQELLITLVPGLPADLVSGKITPDRLLVSRTPPFALCTSEIFFREHSLPSNHDPMAVTANGLRRGSSLLSREQIQQLTEIALLLEKAFGEPQDIEWAFDDHLAILQTRPLSLPEIPLPLPEELLKKISESQVLLEGRGFVAQLGVASGRVRHVDLNTDATNFPTGDIAVTKFPSPELSQIVLKAQAIITDVGGPTGHLATIAREYRTPALFGTEKASLILHDGDEITLDVENKKIYKGFIPELVAMQAQWVNAYRATPELKILRRILHWVAHLHLTDPTAESFTPENCESFHDIIRFCHEKAIDSLIRNYSTKSNLKGLSVHLLETSIPFKLSIIDLGGGIDQDSQKWHEVPSRAILSIPLQSLLDGLHSEEFWNQAMVSPGIKNILASMTKPISMLTNAPVYSGQNLAIISGNYCNVSLRLGYHFNVIDAYCSDMTDENYIYFRFAGGFADNVKKERRARLLARILRGLYFKVNRDKDLVIGKARSLDLLQMRAVLRRLGELIGFSRQLDVQMRHEEKVDELLEKFFSAPESEFRPMDR
jgi:pyruvate,water dikinase